MAELIAVGTAEANSADFALAAGETTVLFLKDASGPLLDSAAVADIQIKSSEGQYFTIGSLSSQHVARVLSGTGTYRVVRKSGAVTGFGVDRN